MAKGRTSKNMVREVSGRPLRYPREWPRESAEEKGIDVSLAVDLVFNAARRFFDVGIVVSADTDIVPSLEAVCNLNRAWGSPRVEVAAWRALKKRPRVPGTPVWCHLLEEADYELVKDITRYSANRPSRGDSLKERPRRPDPYLVSCACRASMQ